MLDALAGELSKVPAPDVPQGRQNLLPHSAWDQAYYARQRKRGKGHNTAVRSRAFKEIRVLHRGWHDRKPYDEAFYRQTLTQRGAERVNLIAQWPQEAEKPLTDFLRCLHADVHSFFFVMRVQLENNGHTTTDSPAPSAG